MLRVKLFPLVMLITLACAGAASAQVLTPAQKEAARVATREKLRQLLATSGPKRGIEIAFRQSDKQPFNFVATTRGGLKNAEMLEVVVGVSDDDTIGFRIYPVYKGNYVNIDKARDGAGLMRKLLNLSNHNFLFWGVDDTGDVFAGYTFTMESGFPDRAIEVVLYSIAPLDQYVGQMRPLLDGSAAAP
jgi:hypothetical protein